MGDLSKWRRTAASRTAANMPNLMAGATTHANGQVLTKDGLNITQQFRAYQDAQGAQTAKKFTDAQNAADVAKVEQAAVEDAMSENSARNKAMTSIAFGQAGGQGGALGRGTFRRRNAAVKISSVLGSLAKSNAGSLKDARLKTVRAQQAADITRSQPQLGYDLALSGVQGQILKNRMV